MLLALDEIMSSPDHTAGWKIVENRFSASFTLVRATDHRAESQAGPGDPIAQLALLVAVLQLPTISAATSRRVHRTRSAPSNRR